MKRKGFKIVLSLVVSCCYSSDKTMSKKITYEVGEILEQSLQSGVSTL